MRALAVAAFVALAVTSPAMATEFDAALGQTGYGRCHMDSCGFFVIDAAAPIGSTKDGTLFAISARWWSAEYKRRGDDDDREYDRPPVSTSPKTPGIEMVFCSKAKPVLFDFYDEKWQATSLRPGDEKAVFGATESGYQFYYAACHHFITKDPISKAMATRLGYAFANHLLKDGEDFGGRRQAPADRCPPVSIGSKLAFGAAMCSAIGLWTAGASEIPKYAIDRSCARFAEYAVGGAIERRDKLAKDCVRAQRVAYDQLKIDWPKLADVEQGLCLRMTGEAANYRSLGNCVRSIVARRAGARDSRR